MTEDAGAGSGRTNWPTVQQQLREAGVRPGTRLEELIRNNQDFHLLRSEELNDRLRIPPWLRVYFLKRQPEITPIPGDPTGGYPLALRDLYKWMVNNQDMPEQGAAGDDDGH